MRYKELIMERVVNAFDDKTKLHYAQEVWNLLQRSYAEVPGGFGSADDIPDLIAKGNLWKLVVRAGEVTAVGIYRDQYGRKSIASGTNGTRQGLADYKMLKAADQKYGRAWAEVSGKPEAALIRAGFQPLPAKFAPVLTNKEIASYNEDGVHYSRMIAGALHEKVIYGSIQVTPELAQRLQDLGIELKALPAHFKS
jgi:hypothetical protein